MARLTSFTHEGNTFDVVDSGPVDGEVIVLLHGFPQRASCWENLTPLLHARGFRTVAPDQRGYSPGARPTRRRDYTVDHLVGDVIALVDALGDAGRRVHLVGHDWGALIGWTLSAQHPDRVRSWTAVSVPPPAALLRSMLGSQLLKSSYIGFFALPWLPEALVRRAPARFGRFLGGSGMSRAETARVQRDIVEYGALPGALGYYRALPLSRSGLLGKRVTVPTTLVWSDGDVALGRAGVDLAGDYVDADYELVVLAGVSHWIPEHAPDALAEAILERVGTA